MPGIRATARTYARPRWVIQMSSGAVRVPYAPVFSAYKAMPLPGWPGLCGP